MYINFNCHPKSLHVGDCSRRSIAVAAEMDYAEVRRALNRNKKISGCKDFNEIKNLETYVVNVLGAEKITFTSEEKKGMTADKFCKLYPRGRYILDMDEHWSCCVDGNIYDTWDTSEEAVQYVYRVQPTGGEITFRGCVRVKPVSDMYSTLTIYDDVGDYLVRTVKNKKIDKHIATLAELGFVRVFL